MKVWCFACTLCAALFAMGSACSGRAGAPMEESKQYAASPTAAPAPSPRFAAAESMADTAGVRPPPQRGADDMRNRPPGSSRKGGKTKPSAEPASPNAPVEQVPTPTPENPRMLVYSGSLKLKVTNQAETLKTAVSINETSGGYIESLSADAVVLRVPVAKFRAVYAALVNLGTVLERAIGAEDVTDAYAALELRLSILSASRERLMIILAKATTVRSKLELLAEIRRLTDEIDQLQRLMQSYASLAQFSRITLNVVSTKLELASRGDEPIAEFRWIHELSPFDPGVASRNTALVLATPAGMVELERDCFACWLSNALWKAESAEGSTVWAHRRVNRPRGTTDFWAEALRERLAPEYAAAEILSMGEFKVLRLMYLKEDSAYRYYVGVRADEGTLQIFEAQFGNAEQEKRYGEAVRKAVSGGSS